MSGKIRLTIWNEGRHEKIDKGVAAVYPKGMHTALADGLKEYGFSIKTATIDEPEHGLTEAVLAETDVLTWWGHMAHEEVSDKIVDRVQKRVLAGMGLIVLHSGHVSKIFRRMMGTSCQLLWRDVGENEHIWVVEPGHPIADGLPLVINLPHEEMYGERFDIPAPDELVLMSWFKGGEVFRSGCCFYRGRGKIFYFRPGHEMYPTYYDHLVLRVIANAVRWAAPVAGPVPELGKQVVQPMEKLD